MVAAVIAGVVAWQVAKRGVAAAASQLKESLADGQAKLDRSLASETARLLRAERLPDYAEALRMTAILQAATTRFAWQRQLVRASIRQAGRIATVDDIANAKRELEPTMSAEDALFTFMRGAATVTLSPAMHEALHDFVVNLAALSNVWIDGRYFVSSDHDAVEQQFLADFNSAAESIRKIAQSDLPGNRLAANES